MTDQRPTITVILRSFFDAELDRAPASRRESVVGVELHLRQFLEREGERGLEAFDRTLLRLERQVGPVGAYCRLMHADDLVLVLGGYLEGGWLAPETAARRLQVQLVRRLVDHLVGSRLVDARRLACPLLEVGAAITRAGG
jgi:hypothetical protein